MWMNTMFSMQAVWHLISLSVMFGQWCFRSSLYSIFSVQSRPRFCIIDAEYLILTQNEIIVESYWCKKVTSYIIITSKAGGKKKSKLKPEKREDRLDKDGEAGEVSSIMSSVQSFNIMVWPWPFLKWPSLKCLVGHMIHLNLYLFYLFSHSQNLILEHEQKLLIKL